MKWLILVLGVISNVSASILVKHAVNSFQQFSLSSFLVIITNVPLLLGIILYGVAFLLYVLALNYFPLNIAHPVLTVSSLALVSMFSVVIFKERFFITTFIGMIFIIIGVVFLTAKLR